MRAPVSRVLVHDTDEHVAALHGVADDLRQAGVIGELVLEPGEPTVHVTLAPLG